MEFSGVPRISLKFLGFPDSDPMNFIFERPLKLKLMMSGGLRDLNIKV